MHTMKGILILPAVVSFVFAVPLPGPAEVLEKSEYLLRVVPDDTFNESMSAPQQEAAPAEAPTGASASVTIKRVSRPVQIKHGTSRSNTRPGAGQPGLKSPAPCGKGRTIPASFGKAIIT